MGTKDSKRMRISRRLIFCIVYSVHRFFVSLPLSVSLALGRCFGYGIYIAFPKRRKIVLENIQILKAWAQTEGLSNAYLKRGDADLAKSIFIQNAENFIFSLVLMSKPKAMIRKHLHLKNSEVLEKVVQENKSLVILFAHYGPWENLSLLPQLLGDHLSGEKRIGAIYRPLVNPLIDRWFRRLRESNGCQLFSRKDGFIAITRFLKMSGVLLVAMDMRLTQGERVPLFNKLASSTTIPLKLIKMTGAVPVFSLFRKVGRKEWEIDFREFPDFNIDTENSDTEEKQAEFLRCMNTFLEQMIANDPTNYFFFQDRYKQ